MKTYQPPNLREDEGIHVDEHTFFISADLGQAQDYTAISIIERICKGSGVLNEVTYNLRHIERPPRGTEYPQIVDRLIAIFESPTMADYEKAVVIDLTGLGRPVFDMMRAAGFRYSLNAISITGGNDAHYTNQHHNVPKRELVTNLQVLLQNGSFKIAKGIKEADALIEELTNFQTKISDSGKDTYGGRQGVHDDIVLSVAMGAWLARQRYFKRGYWM